MSFKHFLCTLAVLELSGPALPAQAPDRQMYWVGVAVAVVPSAKPSKAASWAGIDADEADGAFSASNVRGMGSGTSEPGRPAELTSTVERPLFVPTEGGAFRLSKPPIGWALAVSVEGNFVIFRGFVSAVAPSPSGFCRVELNGRIPYRRNRTYVWRGLSAFGRAGLQERVVVVTLRPLEPAL